jgi:hypothetical protein
MVMFAAAEASARHCGPAVDAAVNEFKHAADKGPTSTALMQWLNQPKVINVRKYIVYVLWDTR